MGDVYLLNQGFWSLWVRFRMLSLLLRLEETENTEPQPLNPRPQANLPANSAASEKP